LNTDNISYILPFKSGEIKAISEVRIGDKILASDSAGNQKYSTVIFIPHKQNNIETLFTHLHTKTRDIKLTPNHVIPAGDCSGKKSLPLLYASQVKIKTKTITKTILFSDLCLKRF
jgi:Hint module